MSMGDESPPGANAHRAPTDASLTVLQHFPLSVIVVDASGRIHMANRAARRLYALPADAEGQVIEDLIVTRGIFAHGGANGDRVLSRLQVETVVRGSGRWSGWMRHVACDGRVLSVDVDITRLGPDTGMAERFVLVGRDITDAERIRYQRDQQRRLAQAVLHVSPTMTVVLDRMGRIVMGNTAWFRTATEVGDVPLVGDDFHRTTFGGARVVPSRDGRTLSEAIDAVLTSDLSPLEIDVEAVDATRSVRTFSVQIVRLIDELADGPAIVVVMTDVTLRRSQERVLAHQANHDVLTGLSNRAMLEESLTRSLGRCERSGRRIAVLFIDLDGFKQVNDHLGHDKGDVVLREMAERLARACRLSDVVARVGGDEFIVLVEDVARPEDVLPLAERILESACQPVRTGAEDIRVTASIGIALSPEQARMPRHEALLHDADTAMYAAKQSGGNRFTVFSPALRARTYPRIGADDRGPLPDGDLSVVYQPVVSISSAVMSVEALIRWHHSELGLVGAEHLLATSAGADGMAEIDAWVLRQVVAQGDLWDHTLPAPAYISMNVDARWLAQPDWANDVLRHLERHAMDPRRLGIEFDHSVLARDPATILSSLHRLAEAGVRLVLDDFGSARSTLGDLDAVPLACVKINAGLMERIEQGSAAVRLLEATTALCHAHGVPVVAKGLAHERWLRLAREAQVDGYQGFSLHRPGSADQIAEWLIDVSRDPRLIPA